MVPLLLLIAVTVAAAMFSPGAGRAPGPFRAAAESPCGPHLQVVETDDITLCTVGPETFDAGRLAWGAVPEAGPGDPRPRVACIGDGSTGPRVQPIYVYEVSKGNRYAQFAATIDAAISGMDQIFMSSAQQTGGIRRLRMVTYSKCAPVIGIVAVPDGSLSTFAGSITAVRAAGYNRTDRNYAMFTDAAVYCGIGTIRADSTPGAANLNNAGSAYARVDASCWSGFAMAHEVMHGIGAVQLDAPHSTGAWHCTDERDVMCYSDQGVNNPPMQQVCTTGVWEFGDYFDCNHDDYFDAGPAPAGYLSTHWNTASSVFLDASGGMYPGIFSISPASGPVGTSVTASLSSFKPGTAAAIKFDGTVVATKVTDATGAATIVFTVPKATVGFHTVLADTNETDAQAAFKVTSSVKTKPKRVRAGQNVELALYGFGDHETVTIKLDGKTLLRAVTRQDGSLETTISMPDNLSPKDHQLIAVGDQGQRATFEVNVKPDREDRRQQDGRKRRSGKAAGARSSRLAP